MSHGPSCRCPICRENIKLKARSKYAWGMYYREVNENIELTKKLVDMGRIMRQNRDEDGSSSLPNHLVHEFLAMSDELKREMTCPVCFNIVTKDNYAITPCGHFFCKTEITMPNGIKRSCYDAALQSTDGTCPTCRKKIKY